MGTKKETPFEKAARECNAIPLDEFIAKLHKRIDELYDKREAEMAKAAEVQKPVVTKRKPARPQQIQPHA